MLKPLVSEFCSDLSVCLKDIAEKQVPAKLSPIADIFSVYLCTVSSVWRESGAGYSRPIFRVHTPSRRMRVVVLFRGARS